MTLKYLHCAIALVFSSLTLYAQTGEVLFQENCSICHGHSEMMTGPPITYISDFKDFEWFVEFLSDPYEMFKAEKDEYTNKMLAYYIPVYALHPPSKLNREELRLVWDYILAIQSDYSKNQMVDSLRNSWKKSK